MTGSRQVALAFAACIAMAGIEHTVAAGVSVEDTARDRYFAEKVRPLLSSRCVSCHGPEKSEGGLRLDSRAAALKGGDSGPALVPGKPDASLLLMAVKRTHKVVEMPPKDKLSSQDVATLDKWIREGAAWPVENAKVESSADKPAERVGNARSDRRNPIVHLFGGQRFDLWSLQPVRRPPLPAVQNG